PTPTTVPQRLPVLACSDNTKDVGYVPLPFSIFGSFYPNVRFFFLCPNIGWIYRRGRKKTPQFLFSFFFCWAQFFAPPSEWRPRRPPIPPVGKNAPAHTHTSYMLSVWWIMCVRESVR